MPFSSWDTMTRRNWDGPGGRCVTIFSTGFRQGTGMNMKRTATGQRMLVLVSLTVLGAWAVGVHAERPQQKDAKADKATPIGTPIVKTDTPPKNPVEKM